jgi:hypothetical protein
MRRVVDLQPSDLSVTDEAAFREWREARAAGDDGTRQGNWLSVPAVALMFLAAVAPGARGVTIPAFVVVTLAMIGFMLVKVAPHNRKARALQGQLGLSERDIRRARKMRP